MTPIATPCIRVCTLDPTRAACLGCGRTLDEIAHWRTLAESERNRIMAMLPDRLARLEAGRGRR